MNLNERLQNVAVIGAGGKMGSGISLLLAQEMTLQKIDPRNKNTTYKLTLMDVSEEALDGLKKYLYAQAMRFAKKNLERLQPFYPGSDESVAGKRFAEDMAAILDTSTALSAVKNAHMVFEAILEKIDLKVRIYSEMKSLCAPSTYFFTNTSSIPIKELDARAGLTGRIIGFHFYNPPAVQKLVELIIPADVNTELPALSRELGKRLRKIVIPANDVAGFIGNGHFMRDGLFGLRQVESLMKKHSFAEAVYMVNRISQDYLVRPMGIFQLIDYVGLDIFQSILKIMNPHFPNESLHSELIDTLVSRGVKGGQYSDGSQKDGFLQYDGGRPTAVFGMDFGDYLSLGESDWQMKAEHFLGSLPEGHHPWKALLKDDRRDEKLSTYFGNMMLDSSEGARLAVAYLQNSRKIGEQLLADHVAGSAADINGVLMNGFFHLYGPINDYV